MHASENKREYLKSGRMAQRSVEFHRSSRASLYQKIETMLHRSVLCRTLGLYLVWNDFYLRYLFYG